MGWLGWILPGLITGFVARLIVPTGRRFGCLGTIVLGILGSVLGGALGSLIAGDDFELTRAGWIGSIVGAVVILVVLRVLGPEDTRRPR